MKKDSKYVYIAMCIVFAIAIVIIAVSLTYAFVIPRKTGTETQTNFKAGKFDIETSLTNASAIEAYNIYPINESQIEYNAPSINFTAGPKSTNTISGNFNIYLKDIAISNNFNNENFKWELLMDGEELASGNFANIETVGVSSTTKTNTSSVKYYDRYDIKTQGTFNGNNQSNFIFRVYILENGGDQTSLTNGLFDAKVAIEGYINS